MTLGALWRIVWHHKYLIGVIAIIGGAIATVLALMAPPIYTAEVVIMEVDDDRLGGASSLINQLGGLASLAGVSLPGGNTGQTSKALLKSRYLIEEFIRRKDLLQQLFPNRKPIPSMWFGVMRFKARVLGIREDTRSKLITVSVRWSDAVTAARMANEFVDLADELLRARALTEANRNVMYLNKQITETNVVEMQRVMYKLIESETKSLMLANARTEYAFSVVDPAVAPGLRTSPRRTLMVLFGLVLGFAVGIAAAVIRNAAKRRTSPLQLA